MASGEYEVRSADDYFYENGPNPGKYDFNGELLGKAHGQCKFRVESDMIKGNSKVFVANTFTTEKELKPYFELAELHGYRVTSLIVENRHNSPGLHDVPKEVIVKMVDRFSIKLI